MIADDSEDLRNRLRILLSTLHCVEVAEEAASAYEAIDKAKKRHVDVAILDIQMPGSGIRALKQIKAKSPDTHVIMLTNHVDPYYRTTCLDAGADYFLDKSMEFEQLPSVLGELTNC